MDRRVAFSNYVSRSRCNPIVLAGGDGPDPALGKIRSVQRTSRILRQRAPKSVVLALALLWSQLSFGHGGVVAEEDLCLMEMGFLQAHFTLYLPDTRGSEEFCEQVPDTGRALFVVEYLHEMMKEMPVEFRIVRDEQGFGIFANWDDVMSIPDLAAQTAFHRPLAAEPTGWVTVGHTFDDPGGYIGVVVAENPANGKVYNSVFYFEVGNAGYGYIPLFIALILGAQLLFFASTGSLQRFLRWIRARSSWPNAG